MKGAKATIIWAIHVNRPRAATARLQEMWEEEERRARRARTRGTRAGLIATAGDGTEDQTKPRPGAGMECESS